MSGDIVRTLSTYPTATRNDAYAHVAKALGASVTPLRARAARKATTARTKYMKADSAVPKQRKFSTWTDGYIDCAATGRMRQTPASSAGYNGLHVPLSRPEGPSVTSRRATSTYCTPSGYMKWR